ncbi:MAG: aspartate--tRNA ligase, partial [Planctomycetes bacterium]|nr:aspartate--tRNA ligase [Planctomycetota bacterium]
MSMRTHTCGELRAEHVGAEVALAGWVASLREHGGVSFLDLRDRYGRTQVVLGPGLSPDLGREYVVRVEGVVRRRPEGTANPRLATGAVEVEARGLEVLNASSAPPLEVGEGDEVSQDVRLRYRYVDLRRPAMQQNLLVRHRVVKAMRDGLDAQGFVEVETPFLTRSTPEGARDYLVPSRVHPGEFYALPQSPQIFKQLLMVAGLDRYFQVVRCFRDEDLRADRQPEFTQLDVEMSFVGEEDVFRVMEGVVEAIFRAAGRAVPALPLGRMSWKEAM